MKLPFKPYDKDAVIQQTERRLPHREQAGCTYFVTWRLGDSVPQSLLTEWLTERAMYMREHPKPWDSARYDDYAQRFERRLERWADEGYGACHLRQPELREVLTTALLHFDQQRYDLIGYAVMPNHAHVLLRPYAGTSAEDEATRKRCALEPNLLPPLSLAGVLKSWKGYTAREINQRLDRKGPLWMDESFDHAVRSATQLQKFCDYITENPTKAALPPGAYDVWLAEPKV